MRKVSILWPEEKKETEKRKEKDKQEKKKRTARGSSYEVSWFLLASMVPMSLFLSLIPKAGRSDPILKDTPDI